MNFKEAIEYMLADEVIQSEYEYENGYRHTEDFVSRSFKSGNDIYYIINDYYCNELHCESGCKTYKLIKNDNRKYDLGLISIMQLLDKEFEVVE
jgi:hypothetical protein